MPGHCRGQKQWRCATSSTEIEFKFSRIPYKIAQAQVFKWNLEEKGEIVDHYWLKQEHAKCCAETEYLSWKLIVYSVRLQGRTWGVGFSTNYSGTSDKGPSEIGTTSLQTTLFQPHANTLVYFLTSEIGTTSLQETVLLSVNSTVITYLTPTKFAKLAEDCWEQILHKYHETYLWEAHKKLLVSFLVASDVSTNTASSVHATVLSCT